MSNKLILRKDQSSLPDDIVWARSCRVICYGSRTNLFLRSPMYQLRRSQFIAFELPSWLSYPAEQYSSHYCTASQACTASIGSAIQLETLYSSCCSGKGEPILNGQHSRMGQHSRTALQQPQRRSLTPAVRRQRHGRVPLAPLVDAAKISEAPTGTLASQHLDSLHKLHGIRPHDFKAFPTTLARPITSSSLNLRQTS
jgi:hypothetical protein